MQQKSAPEPEQTGKKCVVVVRIINIVTALVLIGFGIAGIVILVLSSLPGQKFFLIFSPCFMILFGLMLILAVFKVKILLTHFAFLGSLMGRGVFNIYLSTAVFFYFTCGSDNVALAWVAAGVIFLLGIFYIILHFVAKKRDSDLKQQMV